jgi:hypothetical protein
MFWVEGLDFLILSRSFMSSVLIVRMSVMLEKMLDTSAVFNSPWALTGLTNTYAREDHLSAECPSKMKREKGIVGEDWWGGGYLDDGLQMFDVGHLGLHELPHYLISQSFMPFSVFCAPHAHLLAGRWSITFPFA